MSERVMSQKSSETPESATTPPEWQPAVDARVTRIGMRIFVGADAFFFFAFFFAFFYLRSMNNDYAWLPAGTTHPTLAIGALIEGLAILTALFYFGAMRGASVNRSMLWLALAAGILFLGAQVYEFQNLGFDPQQGGGYPSVFVGLKGLLMVQTAGALLWLGGLIAQSKPGGDMAERRATAASFSMFLWFLAGVGLLAYLVLYFV
jgi:heme/copper-type cytochrome/quinol oxidase subunit 3